MIRGIIFDVDGTTLNTLNDLYVSFNQALKEFGLPARSKDEIRMGVGSGFKVLVDRCTPPDTSEELKQKLGVRYGEIYSENYRKTTVPYDGIRELLVTLKNRNIALAISSNKSDRFVKGLAEKNFPDIEFVEVMGAREGFPHKPDPRGAKFIIEKMGLEKEEVMYVGDSDIDILTGKNAGVKTVGCLWGFRDRETLENAGADIILSEPLELLKYID